MKRFDLKDIDELPNYEELLDRIALIKTEDEDKSDSLYNDFKLPEEEEVPEFLQGEDIEMFTSDEENLNQGEEHGDAI